MGEKRLNFCKKYSNGTTVDWKKVIFSDESTFGLIRGGPMMVRRPKCSSRYDTKFAVKTVKHLDRVMIWDTFCSEKGRAGLYFLPKNMTMNGSKYLEVSQYHLLQFWPLHGYQFLMHDRAPAHKTKLLQK